MEIIRIFDRKEKIIASICVAALAFGKSGILVGRNATTYNMNHGIRPKALADFGAHIINQPVVIDKNVITSWNPSTAMDVAVKLLARLTSAENVQTMMGFA